MNIIKIYNQYRTYIKAAIIVIIVLVAGVVYYCKQSNTSADKQNGKYALKQEASSVKDVDNVDNSTGVKDSETVQDDTDSAAIDISQRAEYGKTDADSKEGLIYVYLYGEVNNPGVVACSMDSRIYEVVQLCGGYTSDADVAKINPVQKVSDGQKIYIPKFGEEYNQEIYDDGISNTVSPYQESGNQSVNSRININTASKEQLVTLPGIGESRAGDIISYRSKHGSFKSIDDIKNVPGIKDGAFSKIKDYICV